jgi:7,8-dihydroneopterin aldolase/epimerase/oxygenase
VSDRIGIAGLEVFAHHGVYEREHEDGQVFVVDLEVEIDLSAASASDDLSDTLDYGELAVAVRDRVADERWNLIERVAGRVAELVLEDPRVRRVRVTVHKPSAPIEVSVADLFVTVDRSR